MKKRLFALAAAAVALTMAFGFAACGDGNGTTGGNNQQTEQGGETGNQTPEQGGESGNQTPEQGGESGNQTPEQGGESGNQTPAVKLTEAEWKKAFEDTLASKTVSLVGQQTMTMTMPAQDGEGTVTQKEEITMTAKLDMENNLMTTEYKAVMTGDGVEKEETVESQSYTEVSGTRLNSYNISVYTGQTNAKWYCNSTDKETAELAKEAFKEEADKSFWMQAAVYNDYTATINGEKVKKDSLAELYAAFEFDSTDNIYSAELTLYAGSANEMTYMIEVGFKDGKLSKLVATVNEVEGEGAAAMTMQGTATNTFDYGAVNIVIPQAAKDALAAEQGA